MLSVLIISSGSREKISALLQWQGFLHPGAIPLCLFATKNSGNG
jgi:hypothetical protein